MVQVNHLPAALADQVVVGLVRNDLVLGTAPAQVGLTEDAQVAKPFQGAIDGRAIHFAQVSCRPLVDSLGAGMTAQFAKGTENRNPLSRHSQDVLARSIHNRLKNIHEKSSCNSLQLDYT